MAWIESHQELGRHPKTRRLARMLGISLPAAVGHLHYLWWWALDFAEDGDLSAYDIYEIAEAAMWEGDPDEIVDALVHARFLDRTGDGGLVLHDWDEYAGRLIERRAKDRERKRRERAAKRASRGDGDVRETSAGHPQDGQGTSVATVPITVPIPNLGGGIYDDALGTRKEIAAASDDTPTTSGYEPATATDVMIADDSVTPGQYFERLWGVYPTTIDDLLASYEGRLHPSAVKWAIWEARLAGQRRASYLRAILDRLVAQGLTTAAAAQAYEEERRQRDRDRPPKAASMDGAPNASAYAEIDRETVDRYAALIYAAGEVAVADDADAGAAPAPDKPP